MKCLPREFYLQEDVVSLSKSLLGKYLFTSLNGEVTGGKIIETEAYKGPEDKASHAYKNRRTARTEVMFHKGGICYVYLCYGMHNLLNVVTSEEGIPHAILLRALEPLEGIEIMLKRRKKTHLDATLTAGPGSVAMALGVDRKFNGASLLGPLIWIEEGEFPSEKNISIGPRVGIDYAQEHALLPWRFKLMPS